MLRIPWIEKRTNVSVLAEMGENECLRSKCTRHLLQYFGHIMRRESGNLEKMVIQGKVDGRRSRGRSPNRWSDQIRESCGEPLQIVIRTTLLNSWCIYVRHGWHRMMMITIKFQITNSKIRFDLKSQKFDPISSENH